MITPEFFEKREKKLDEYRAKGYLPLDEIMQQNNINAQQLIDVSLLQILVPTLCVGTHTAVRIGYRTYGQAAGVKA